jgi:hypothetical protein
LNDSHIQALADGEGTDEMRRHAADCAACAARLHARETLMADIAQSVIPPVEIPPALAAQAGAAFRQTAVAGATRLLNHRQGGFRLQAEDYRQAEDHQRLQAEDPSLHAKDRRWIYSALAVAAATLIAVLFVTPAVRKRDATLSAAEILAKSASQLSARVTGGIELLEYELVLSGVPKEMMPDSADGVYRIRQAIDHDVRGRFHFTSFAPDGSMLTSIAQDPAANRRVMAFTVDGQPYRFNVSLPAKDAGMSLPEMERLHMEASITMMQASGNQLVETIDGPQGKLYRIEVPRVTGPGTSPVWDLTDARVLIDARDYRVTEFAVSGSFLKQAYSLSYKLIRHSVVGSVPADTFLVPDQPGQIVIQGEGSQLPAHDVLVLSLRELTKLKHQ